MPCNGVVVANGRIEMKVAELIFTIPTDKLRDALAAAMVQQIPELAGARPKKLPYKYDRGVTDFGFALGPYLVGIQKNGWVNVSLSGRESEVRRVLDPQTTKTLHEMITNLLTGLAGLALQQQIARQVIAAGCVVERVQQAPNGALVMEVEL
jgi:hypothetical protein